MTPKSRPSARRLFGFGWMGLLDEADSRRTTATSGEFQNVASPLLQEGSFAKNREATRPRHQYSAKTSSATIRPIPSTRGSRVCNPEHRGLRPGRPPHENHALYRIFCITSSRSPCAHDAGLPASDQPTSYQSAVTKAQNARSGGPAHTVGGG